MCVGLACTSPCRCSMGRAVVLDLSGKERVNPGAHVGSSPDTSADPLCDPSSSSASPALASSSIKWKQQHPFQQAYKVTLFIQRFQSNG